MISKRGDYNKARKASSESSDDVNAALVNKSKAFENNRKVGCNEKKPVSAESSNDNDQMSSANCKAGQSLKNNYKKSNKRKKLNSNSESSDNSDNKEEISSKHKKKTKTNNEKDCMNLIETIILIAK